MSTEKRMLVLLNFQQGASNVLISTDLTSRGIDFGLAVDTVVSFDLSKNEHEEMARICRANKVNSECNCSN